MAQLSPDKRDFCPWDGFQATCISLAIMGPKPPSATGWLQLKLSLLRTNEAAETGRTLMTIRRTVVIDSNDHQQTGGQMPIMARSPVFWPLTQYTTADHQQMHAGLGGDCSPHQHITSKETCCLKGCSCLINLDFLKSTMYIRIGLIITSNNY